MTEEVLKTRWEERWRGVSFGLSAGVRALVEFLLSAGFWRFMKWDGGLFVLEIIKYPHFAMKAPFTLSSSFPSALPCSLVALPYNVTRG